jgi:hypothetical protein
MGAAGRFRLFERAAGARESGSASLLPRHHDGIVAESGSASFYYICRGASGERLGIFV